MMSLNPSDWIAILALLVSAYAAIVTALFNRRQKSLIESQDKLNRLMLKKEEEGSQDIKRAELGSTIIKLGSNKYRLRIWNKGKSAARNVSISFPDGNEIVPDGAIRETFPLEVLEPHNSVDLPALVILQTRRKQVVEITWSDDSGDNNKKLTYPTI
jgi:hypothetical protein